jgi:hypothetical protein
MTEIRIIEGRGRSVFATSPLNKSSVIYCESPICTVHYSLDKETEQSWSAYRPHELNLISTSGDIKSISLVLLAARTLECIQNSNEIANLIHQFCVPTILNEKEIRKLHIYAVLIKQLLIKIDIDVTQEKCFDIVSRLVCNIFTITDSASDPVGIGVYVQSSAVNHSCNPNSSQTFNNLTLTITTDRDIAINEEVTISYTDTSKSTWCRRYNLITSYYFGCMCERCMEIDTFDQILCKSNMQSSNNKHIEISNNCFYIPFDGYTSQNQLQRLESLWLCRHSNSYIKSHSNNEKLDLFIAFVDDLCIPFGDIWLSNILLLHSMEDSSPCTSDMREITKDHNLSGFANFMLNNIPLNIDVWIGNSIASNMICDKCNISVPMFQFVHIKTLFDMWISYKQHLTLPINNTNNIIQLKHHIETVRLLNDIYDVLLTIVSNCHYSILQISHKLVTTQISICLVYEVLLGSSPNNKKLKNDLNENREKYIKYSEIMEKSLKQCYPKYVEGKDYDDLHF